MKAIQPLPFEMKITKRGMIENIFKNFLLQEKLKLEMLNLIEVLL